MREPRTVLPSTAEVHADRRVERVAVEALEQTTDGGRMRYGSDAGERIGREAEVVQDGRRGVGGPFTDRDEGAGAGRHGRGGRTQQGRHRIPPSSMAAWIRHPGQEPTQVSGVLRDAAKVREGQLSQPGGHG